MVSALLFLLLTIAIVVAWCGQRQLALGIFAINMLGAIAWFIHHMTTVIGLVL